RWRRQLPPPGLFSLGTGRVAGDGCGKAFIDPVPGLQLASHCGVTDRLMVFGAIITEEMDRPAFFNRAEVAGAGGQRLLELLGDVLAFRGRPSRLGRGMEPCQARAAIRLEPSAHGVLVAVEPLGNLRDTPALRIQRDVVTALSELWPGTPLCSNRAYS